MTQYGTWVSYGGPARIGLAIALLSVAGCLMYAGTRVPLPVSAARPGRAAATFMLLSWALALVLFLVCVLVYGQQAQQKQLAEAPPADPITPVTVIAAGIIFFIVLLCKGSYSARATLASGVIAALAAPMIFELPFDLIVMARTYPAIPPDPALYRALVFLPLLLIEITTLSLLTLSPMVKLSRATFFSFALMLTVFAVWSLAGFAYPSTPFPIAMNVLSKILAFVTALSLFLPQRARASTSATAATAAGTPI
jgi:hypothetical protein